MEHSNCSDAGLAGLKDATQLSDLASEMVGGDFHYRWK